jgi:hypothetical protein
LARRFGEDADPPGRAPSSCEARVTTRRSDRGRADTERGAVANPACIARTCIAAPLGVPADAPRLLEKAQQKSLVDISFVTPTFVHHGDQYTFYAQTVRLGFLATSLVFF